MELDVLDVPVGRLVRGAASRCVLICAGATALGLGVTPGLARTGFRKAGAGVRPIRHRTRVNPNVDVVLDHGQTSAPTTGAMRTPTTTPRMVLDVGPGVGQRPGQSVELRDHEGCRRRTPGVAPVAPRWSRSAPDRHGSGRPDAELVPEGNHLIRYQHPTPAPYYMAQAPPPVRSISCVPVQSCDAPLRGPDVDGAAPQIKPS